MKNIIRKIIKHIGYDLVAIDPLYSQSKSRKFLELLAVENKQNDDFLLSPIKVHMFWAYGNLSKLEILCAKSFIQSGYDLLFWSYEKINNLPEGAILRDAGEILPEHRVFKYQNGSYAGFADLFRYAVLCKEGGLWADTDVICLLPMNTLQKSSIDSFVVMEETEQGQQLNNNVIYCAHPRAGDIVDLAFAISDRFDTEKVRWGDCGPLLLTSLAKTYPNIAPVIMEANFANPVEWWKCPDILRRTQIYSSIPSEWGFLHCFNETWRRSGIDKNASYPPGSLLSRIEVMFP
ncbi:MAG: hypothetical protein H7240_07930 [Glaciimonas sp.]|nr:hypothetical protein [Glaciimonas sp.]